MMSIADVKLSMSIDGLPVKHAYRNTRPERCANSQDTVLTLVLISLFSLIVLLMQYIFQGLDNNRLLSWQWVMDRQRILSILGIATVGMFIVYRCCYLHLNRQLVLCMLLTGSFVFGIYTWSLPEFMLDSARYLAYAKFIESQGVGEFISGWGSTINAWTDLPLVPLIYGVAFSVFSESRIVLQIINTLFFSASVYVVYQIGKQLWHERLGLYAAFFLLAIPFLHMQPSQLMVDIASLFFVSFAVLATIMALKHQSSGWAVVAGFSIVLALLCKYSAWLVLLSLLTIPCIFYCGKNVYLKFIIDKQVIVIFLLCAVQLTALYYFYQDLVLSQLRILLEYQVPALQRWHESYISTFFYQVHPYVTLAAISALFIAIKKHDRRLLLPISAIGLMLIMGVNRARYLIIIFPFLALLAAYGISQIKNELVGKFITGNALMLSLVISLFANMGFLHGTSASNIKQAGEYINTLAEQEVAVVLLPQTASTVNPQVVLPMLDYFTEKKVYLFFNPAESKTDYGVGLGTSSTRFTWEMAYSPYIEKNTVSVLHKPVIAVIASQMNQQIPLWVKQNMSAYQLDRSFDISDKVFRFQTRVSLYRYKGHGF